MIVLLKINASGKIFLKAIRDTFFSNMQSVFRDRGTPFFSGDDIQQKMKVQTSWLAGRPPKFLPLVGNSDLPIRKTLKRVLDSLTVMILKRVSESIFFQINKFTACKFTKEVANSLMAFNLLKIIHPFQGKKHLRTQSNLNCKPQEYLISY